MKKKCDWSEDITSEEVESVYLNWVSGISWRVFIWIWLSYLEMIVWEHNKNNGANAKIINDCNALSGLKKELERIVEAEDRFVTPSLEYKKRCLLIE